MTTFHVNDVFNVYLLQPFHFNDITEHSSNATTICTPGLNLAYRIMTLKYDFEFVSGVCQKCKTLHHDDVRI